MKRKPLIITGFDRESTTALADTLNQDGRLFITNECWQFLPEFDDNQGIYINLQWSDTVHRLDELFERHGASLATLFPYNFRRSLFNDWLDSQLPDSVEYIGDKSTQPYLYGSKFIMERATPDTKVIVVTRDGRDSIISPEFGKNAWPTTNRTVESWINCAIILKDYLLAEHFSKCLVLKHEQARTNAEALSTTVSDFLELDKRLAITGENYPILNESWRDKYPDMTDQIKKTHPEFPGLLEFFGYDQN